MELMQHRRHWAWEDQEEFNLLAAVLLLVLWAYVIHLYLSFLRRPVLQ